MILLTSTQCEQLLAAPDPSGIFTIFTRPTPA